MSAVNSQRALPPQGGLARLVSKFENLGGSSKPVRNDGEASGSAFFDSRPSKTPSVHDGVQDAAESSKAATSQPPAPNSASPAKHEYTAHSELAIENLHITNNSTPPSKPKRPLARSGSVVAEMRRLFERGSIENNASSG
jgi:hypothetical protein